MTTPFQPLPCDDGGGQSPGGGGGCCSPSIASGRVCLPDGTPVLLVLRSGCADCGGAAADPEAAGWIDPATGAFTAGLPPGAGPCEQECGTVTVLRLCDVGDDSGGACVPFLRFLSVTCGGEVAATVDRAADGVTPYQVSGSVIECDDCPCTDGAKSFGLCDYQPDGTSVPFVRHVTYDCMTGLVVAQEDTDASGAPYYPSGEIGECGQCRPAPMCPRLLGLSGPESWEMPEGTESVSVTVACGPVTIIDCAGNPTRINECGTTFSWSAPPTGGCEAATLCSPFVVDIPADGAAYISFLAPCDLGDVS